jgi:lambda family phage tail tape measure protein
MGEKDIYIERLSQQLEDWKAEISELEAQAESAGEDIHEHCEGALDALKKYYASTEASVEDWLESTDDAWEILEEKAEQKMEAATTAIKTAISHIRTMIG